MNRLITFGGFAYDEITAHMVQAAPRFGVDSVWVYDDKWLMGTELFSRHEFQWLYHHVDSIKPLPRRGFGFFAWKPYVIADALSRCDEGDTVLFVDADTYPIADLSVLYRECERIGGTMLFSAVGCHHARWCKRDCFIQMGMDEPKWRDRQHAVARFMLFQKGVAGVDNFLAEWQHYCLDPDCQTFDPSRLAPEHPEFGEHRCEQAILTNVAHKYGHKLYREACQFGESVNDDRDLYPQLFFQDGRTAPHILAGSRYFNVPGASR